MTQHTRALIALMLSVFIWGNAFVGIRDGLHYFSPGSLGLLRYMISSVFVLPIYFLLPKRTLPRLKDIPQLFCLGLLGIGLYTVLLNMGETTTSASVASFVISQSPLLTIVLAVIFLRERLTRLSWFGLLISISGVTLIAIAESENLGHFNHGIFYLIGAVVSTSLYSILQKPLLSRFQPLELVAWSIWFGTLILSFYFPDLAKEVPRQELSHYISPLFLGMFAGIFGYALLAYGVKYYPVSKAASFFLAMPFISTLTGWIFLDEVPTVMALLGGLIAISGGLFVKVIPAKS